MMTTNDSSIWERAWSHRDHGRRFDNVEPRERGTGYRWVYETVGTTWRMTEMQSAIGRSCPEIYREKALETFEPANRFKAAQKLGETSLAFLVHPKVQGSDVMDVIDAEQKVMAHASV